MTFYHFFYVYSLHAIIFLKKAFLSSPFIYAFQYKLIESNFMNYSMFLSLFILVLKIIIFILFLFGPSGWLFRYFPIII